MMITPTRNDVLCGKDKSCLQAEGSVRFREIIDSFLPKYLKCRTKFEKMTMTKEIYEIVSRDSRFLKFNEADQCWEEISAMAARDKIGHSLRFSNRAKRRHLKKKNKTQNPDKPSGSAPSMSCSTESESNPFTMESLLQKSVSNESFLKVFSSSSSLSSLLKPSNNTSFPPISDSSDQVSEFMGHLRLNQRSEVNNSNSMDSMDDLKKNLVGEGNIRSSFSKFVIEAMNLLKAVEESKMIQTTETSEISKGETKEKDSLMSLLSEPVGDWDEDRGMELPLLCQTNSNDQFLY